jgi:hypothetical protein
MIMTLYRTAAPRRLLHPRPRPGRVSRLGKSRRAIRFRTCADDRCRRAKVNEMAKVQSQKSIGNQINSIERLAQRRWHPDEINCQYDLANGPPNSCTARHRPQTAGGRHVRQFAEHNLSEGFGRRCPDLRRFHSERRPDHNDPNLDSAFRLWRHSKQLGVLRLSHHTTSRGNPKVFASTLPMSDDPDHREGSRKRLELLQTVAIWLFNGVDATREESQRRERSAIAGAEGATAPETLRQKDRPAR